MIRICTLVLLLALLVPTISAQAVYANPYEKDFVGITFTKSLGNTSKVYTLQNESGTEPKTVFSFNVAVNYFGDLIIDQTFPMHLYTQTSFINLVRSARLEISDGATLKTFTSYEYQETDISYDTTDENLRSYDTLLLFDLSQDPVRLRSGQVAQVTLLLEFNDFREGGYKDGATVQAYFDSYDFASGTYRDISAQEVSFDQTTLYGSIHSIQSAQIITVGFNALSAQSAQSENSSYTFTFLASALGAEFSLELGSREALPESLLKSMIFVVDGDYHQATSNIIESIELKLTNTDNNEQAVLLKTAEFHELTIEITLKPEAVEYDFYLHNVDLNYAFGLKKFISY